MKNSHIAILSALGLILLIMLSLLIAGRVILGNSPSAESSNSSINRKESLEGEARDEVYGFEDFDSVTVEGFWDLKIEQGAEYSVAVSYPGSWGQTSVVEASGQTLILGFPENHRDVDESAVARVVMPELAALRIDGFGSVSFSGFDCNDLTTVIEGAGQVTGRDSAARNLEVEVNGAGQVDYEDLTSIDAEVILDGAGQVKLLMDGGRLTGRIDGVGRVVYSGEVSAERISVGGMGRVKYLH